MKIFPARSFLRFALIISSLACVPYSEADAPKTKDDIYDETADGEKQVAAALAEAKSGNKRVLLQFGANWCGWCHRLYGLLTEDKTLHDELQKEYVLVLIDLRNGHNKATNNQYGNPASKDPHVLAVLDADGKLLTTKDNGELEEGEQYSPAKVLAFLQEWAPKR